MTRDVASLRGVLIGTVLLLGLVIATLLLTMGWWNRNGSSLVRNGRVAQADGRRFGQSAPAARCVDEVLARYARTPPDPGTAATERLFLQGCLAVAAASPEVCRPTAGGSSRDWLAALCAARRVTEAGCPAMLRPLADYCSSREHGTSPQQ